MLYVIKKKLSHICYTLIEEVGKYLDVLESELFDGSPDLGAFPVLSS